MNYYEILEIDSGASKDEIERAFRKVARRVHPDLSRGDARAEERIEERMKELNEIRDTLTDALLRAGYDERLRLEALQNSKRAAPSAPPRPARAEGRAKSQRSVELGAPGEPNAEAASWKRLGLLALGAAVVASAVIISLPHEGTPRAPAPPPTPAPLPPPRPAAPPAPRPPRQGARARGVVHLGSPVDQVLRAFGPPDRIDRGARPGDATFHYGKLKLEITNGRVTGGDAAVR